MSIDHTAVAAAHDRLAQELRGKEQRRRDAVRSGHTALAPRTIPAQDDYPTAFPDWAHPAPNPYGVVFPAALTQTECQELSRCIDDEEPADRFHFPGCGATTRQYWTHGSDASPRQRAALHPIADLARRANETWWQYVIDAEPAAWLQSYATTRGYPVHMDTGPGQTRKLTAVAMLTPANEYDGGELTLITGDQPHRHYAIPRDQGTVVVFQSWLMHSVSDIPRGRRQTVNAGFYGPPLR